MSNIVDVELLQVQIEYILKESVFFSKPKFLYLYKRIIVKTIAT